jgi:hypothetical protein
MNTLQESYKPVVISGKELVLSLLQLDYFGPDETGKKPAQEDLTCIICSTKGISVGSATIDPMSGEMKPICEDCEVVEFAKRYSYTDIQAATNRRRRIYDVHYLFVELLAKAYEKLGEFTNQDWEDQELEKLFLYAQKIWSKLPQAEIMALELNQDQNQIEQALSNLIETKNCMVGLTVFMAMDLDEFGG